MRAGDERAAQSSRPPWLSRLLHHAARILLLAATAIAVYLFFPAARISDSAILERGVVAPNDVIAEFAFQIPKAEADLLRERAEAASGVPPVFDFAPEAGDGVVAGVRSFFATLDSIAQATPEPERRDAVRAFAERNRVSPTPASLDLLLDPQARAQVLRATERAVREFFPLGVAASTVDREGLSAIRVRGTGAGERLISADSLLTPERVYQLAVDQLPEGLGPEGAELQRLVLIRFFQPSLAPNAAETEAARDRARAAVVPVRATVLQGEKIVGAREQIGEEEEARLRAYQAALSARGLDQGVEDIGLRAVGAVLFNALVIGIFGALLWFMRRTVYRDGRALLVLALLIVAVTGASSLIADLELPPELIPVPFAILIVAVLWGGRLALSLALILALLLGGQTPFLGITVPFGAAVAGAAAAFSVRAAQRRSRAWLCVAVISLAYAAAALTMGLLRSREAGEILLSAGWGIGNALVSAFLAIGFLPLLESFTRVTTDQTLLELSDLNRPLLKRLSLEAPGTYAHTINVGNLAEAACNAIGANGLLARVGVYYHDIGKLVKPHFFIENQPRGRNPHDKMKPSTSAGIIRSHVVEGMRLADGERLPQSIRSFISEHHGTQRISFFYDRARELEPNAQLNLAEFTYPGPKPQTRETAVVMMADSVESAARVLQDPDPVRIRELVDRIVAGKIAAGQLDECPLTLREIDIIKEHLAKVLTGMYHHRIDYPAPSLAPEPASPAPIAVASPTRAAG